MNRNWIMSLLAWCLSQAAIAGDQEHLTTCEPRLAETLQSPEEFQGTPMLELSWTVRSTERIQLLLAMRDGKYYLNYFRRNHPYHDELLEQAREAKSGEPSGLPADRNWSHYREIGAPLALSLNEAIAGWMSGATEQAGLGRDGVTYYLESAAQCASFWSPKRGTVNHMRQTLLEMLQNLADQPRTERDPEEESRILAWLWLIDYAGTHLQP